MNDRPRFTGILNTSKYPGDTVIQLPPPSNGPSDLRPTILNGSPYPPWSGTQHVALALMTPGTARRRSTPSRTSCATPSDFRNRGPDSDILMVSTFEASKPG